MAIRELGDQPADLLARYRRLCEASGIARANGVTLAIPAQHELAALERRLLVLVGTGPVEVRSPNPPEPAPEQRRVTAPRLLKPLPAPTALATTLADPSPAEQPDRASAIIYTDGAAEGNPGPGGYCAIVRIPGRPDRELSGSSIHTTNNKMELTAAIAGLRAVAEAGIGTVTVFSDSEYLIKGMTEWLPDWERRGWKTATGQPVKNQELWQELASLCRGRRVTWQWVRGHAGHPENERCDLVATAAARRAARARPSGG